MNLQMLITFFTTGGPWGLLGGVVGYVVGLFFGASEAFATVGLLVGFSSPLWWPKKS